MARTNTNTGGGGGGISGSGALGEATFWTGTNTISGSGNFLFTDGANPIFQVGDIANAGNNTTFDVNDSNQTLTAASTNGSMMNLDNVNNLT